MAGSQHRFWGGVVSDSGGRGRHAIGEVRLRQRFMGNSGNAADYFHGRPAHQNLHRQVRRGHGLAQARSRFWLHRLHLDVIDLRLIHLHFFALKAAAMAYALELALALALALASGVAPRWAHLFCALVVIPLVTHGVSATSRCGW